jgi:N-methylhydantoinase B
MEPAVEQAVVKDVDPITREVVQNQLTTVVREMSLTLARAAYSPIIYEVKDFSSVLLRPDASVIAQAEGIPVFLGSMHQTLPPILDRYELSEMRPGDLYISNDPHSGNGTHKNDVNLLRPLFWDDEPVYFAVTKAHWTDIGGKDPGSWSPDATNMYQEGISIPPLRLSREGVMSDEVLELILANVRLREANVGDLMAQVSAAHTADVRFQELMGRFGRAEVERYVDSILDYSEARIRAALREVPDGVYRGEDMVDSDGVSDNPVKVVVEVRVEGDEITFDFTECEDQRLGACGNAHHACTHGAARVAMKCLFGPEIDPNEGFYRPLTIITRPGSVTHAIEPAPGTPWDNIGRAIMEAIFFALAPALPERVSAGIFGGVQAMAIAGEVPSTNEPYIHFMPYAGGWGARATLDGMNALCPLLNGDNFNVPCEVIEAKYPLTVEQYGLIADSGGAGKFRGGLGVRIDYRILSEDATISASIARFRFEPPGLFGGGGGKRSALMLNLGTPEEENRPIIGGVQVPGGSVVSHQCGGGGGYGDPRERDPARIKDDVLDGYVTPEAARSDYGFSDA